MLSYQWTSAFLGLVIGCMIIFLVRRDYLRPSYAVSWIFTAVAIIGIAVKPKLFDSIGEKLGVNYPPILIIILGMGFVLIKILTMDIDRSKRERRLRRLVQRLAILESRMEEVEGVGSSKGEKDTV